MPKNMIYSLIFNSDLSTNSFYGNEIDRSVILSLIEEKNAEKIGISRGDLLILSTYSKLSQIKVNKNQQSYAKKPDIDLLKHAISELYHSITESFHWIIDDFDSFTLIKDNHYINTVCNLNHDQIEKLNEKLKPIKSYIGFFELDLGNPIHMDLFYGALIKDIILNDNKIYYKSYNADPKVIEPTWAKSHGIKYFPIEESEFSEIFPCKFKLKKLSNRGSKFKKILDQFDTPFTFLIKTLASHLLSNQSKQIDFTFNNDEKFTFDKIIIPSKKIEGYSLNPEHKDGKNKAIVFEKTLGIKKENADFLISQIKEGILKETPEKVKITVHGIKYDVNMQIQGKNKKNLTIRTAWIIDQNKNIKLTTAYILDKNKQENKTINDIHYIEKNEKDYFKKVFNQAEAEATKISNKHIITPLYLQGTKEPILDGLCGSGYLKFDKRTVFYKWLIKNKKIKNDESEYHPPLQTQSFELNEVYIETMYKIFQLNNIKCKIHKYYS
ncbi:hypothetical protein EHQ90_10485 [Leptospira stimsonii]|uniref:DUF6883 domain-containing protein n=1 Tax=Leptospira stimsonii TaxID=2202203 RepID=A0ABY2N3G9_9LEPT|nr:DUF6883 domain-containing protein [Leptospira stimsonii]TGM14899.1 hypothetical protein EHQ90_10485 [Leptospira stimsonii]